MLIYTVVDFYLLMVLAFSMSTSKCILWPNVHSLSGSLSAT